MSAAADGKRYDTLDAVRGVALLGIFLMNVEWFSRPVSEIGLGPPPGLTGADAIAAWGVYALVQGKFWVLFSLLFGMGFVLMASRAEAAGRALAPAYLRRLAMLAVFGVLHAVLLWTGDILLGYAIAGVGLLVLQRLRGPALWMLGGALYLALAGLSLVAALAIAWLPPEAMEQMQAAREAGRVAAEVYARGDFAAVTAQRMTDFAARLSSYAAVAPMALGVFLIGAWLLRSGMVLDPPAHRRPLRRMAAVGLALGTPLVALAVWLAWTRAQDVGGQYLATSVMTVGSLPMALAYLALLALGLSAPWAHGLRAWLAPAGRMALTHYLLQSLVASWVFFGYGLGLYGQIGRAGQTLLVLGVFALQLLASRWWMARFAHGPLEWLWRTFTLLQRPPLRRPAGPESGRA